MNFLLQYLRPGDLFLDVGANVGVFSIIIGGMPGVQVDAYEPSTESFQRLVENASLNQSCALINCNKVAVSDYGGTTCITTGLGPLNRFVSDGEDRDVETIPVVRLEETVTERKGVLALKISVEGAELAVLRGAERILQEWGTVLILAHHQPENCLPGAPSDGDVDLYLRSLGFSHSSFDVRSGRLSELPSPIRGAAFSLLLRDYGLAEQRICQARI